MKFNQIRNNFTFDVGGISEYAKMTLMVDYEMGYYDHPCPHVSDGKNPLVVMVTNEGGYNITIACVACIQEAAKIVKEWRKK